MSGVTSRIETVSRWMDSYGGEARGIHRYLPYERDNNLLRSLIQVSGLWISGCGGLTSMSSYFLGPLLFGLGYKDTMICGLLGTWVGCLVAAYCSTMGPRSGLRQMCSARYLFGPWGVRFVSLVTIVGFLGWSVTNCVLGGEILKWISNGKLDLEVGIAILSVISLCIAIFGIEYVLKFETLVGVPVFIVVILLYIIARKEIVQFHDLPTYGDNMTKIGDRISFFTLAYSVTATWGGCASDYYVLLPETMSQVKLFTFTFFAISIPTTIGGVIGLLIGNAAVGIESWYEEYENNSLGGLLNLVFAKWNGFGKFLLIILWLSLITNNIINTYSSALSVQLIDRWFFKHFPRWLIVVVIFIITLVCSMAGRNKFSTILSNFLPMLGYWISIYFTLLIEENVIFRSTRLIKLYRVELYENRDNEPENDPYHHEDEDEAEVENHSEKKAPQFSELTSSSESRPPFSTTPSVPYYNFEAWDTKEKQSHGYAACLAFCFGVVGVVLGMNQVYYVGRLARLIGEYHADLGTFLAIGFTGVTYPVFRYFELRKFGR